MLCTSLGILHGRKAYQFVHGERLRVRLWVEIGLGLLDLYLGRGKVRSGTSHLRSGLVVVPTALAMAHLSVVAGMLTILPPHTSSSRPLRPLLQWLAPYALSTLPDRRTFSITPSPAMALPGWLPPTPWINVITWRNHMLMVTCRPRLCLVFSCPSFHSPLPSRPRWGLRENFFCLGEPAEGFRLSLLYISMNCFLTCLGYSDLRC